jgi:PAS domain S-box-containing protein
MRANNRSKVALARDGCVDAHQYPAWARIAELTRAALEVGSVLDLAQAAVKVIGDELADVDYVCVGEIAPIGLRRIAAVGIAQDQIPRMLDPDPSMYLAMRSVRAGECVVITDWDTEVRSLERAWLQLDGVKSSAFLPIRTYPGGHVFGFLGVHAGRARDFPEQEIVYLELVANVLGGAIAREQAQELAAEHLQQFRALAENTPDVVSRFDRDLRIIYVNGTVERLTGLPASKVVGCTVRDMRMNEPQACALDLALRQVLRTGTQRTLDFEAPTVFDPGPRTFQTYIAPELDLDGKVRSVVLTARDITQHQRTEQECLVTHNRVLAQLDSFRDLIAGLTATHRQQIATVVVEGRLTPRERQILNMIARGWSNREIAVELSVSRGNVKNQVSRLLQKLDVSDRTQAATQAVRLGLVDEQ